MTVPLHIAMHGMDLGLTHTTAATLLTVIGGASIAGRLTVGASVDRIGGRNAYVLCFVPLLIGLLSLLVVETPWLLFPAVAVYGFAHGGFFTVVSPTVAELFGIRAHGAIFGGDRVLRHDWRSGRPDPGGAGLRRDRQLCLGLHRPCRDGGARTGPGHLAAASPAGAARSSLTRDSRGLELSRFSGR